MKKEKIALFGDTVLRETASPVKVFHKKLHLLIDAMKYTLDATDDAAALAAPQISVSKRITVIDYLGEYIEMVNPEILEMHGEETAYEGCLSLPGFSGAVKRAYTVKVKFQDRHGKEKVIERSGAMARCIQHEIDHLDGILYIDRMSDEYVRNDEKKSLLSVRDLRRLTPVTNASFAGSDNIRP
jgi:peptide deformylase